MRQLKLLNGLESGLYGVLEIGLRGGFRVIIIICLGVNLKGIKYITYTFESHITY